MSLDIAVQSKGISCYMCGDRYGVIKSNFQISYSYNYKGLGHIPICTKCIDKIYKSYLDEIHDPKLAMRQTCRNLNIYWSESIYNYALQKSVMSNIVIPYISRSNHKKYIGKSYDDTLREEKSLWVFSNYDNRKFTREDINIPDDVIVFWGRGYSSDMYLELEERKKAWIEKLKSEGVVLDAGGEALIKQICNLEIEINRLRIEGKSIEKHVNSLNTLLGSLNLKPVQGKVGDLGQDLENQPMGVWIKKWEDEEPIPEIDPDLEDVDGLKKYVDVWFRGHLAKMLGIKTAQSKLYEEEINKLKVDNPVMSDDDDEDLIYNVLGDNEDIDINNLLDGENDE